MNNYVQSEALPSCFQHPQEIQDECHIQYQVSKQNRESKHEKDKNKIITKNRK